MHPSEQVEARALWEVTLYLPLTIVQAEGGVSHGTALRGVVEKAPRDGGETSPDWAEVTTLGKMCGCHSSS